MAQRVATAAVLIVFLIVMMYFGGVVMGIGAKIFTLSGPVLVYGIGSSILVGLIAALAGVIG